MASTEPIDETDSGQELQAISSMEEKGGGEETPPPRAQGHVVAIRAHDPYEDEEEVCGICLEAPGPGKLATLWCCKNVLCLADAQKVGACPFCREEPLVWQLNHNAK